MANIKPKNKVKDSSIPVRVTGALRIKIERRAKEEKTSKSELIRRALEKYLK